MTEQEYLDQQIIIITTEQPHGITLDFENSKICDDIFTQTYIGEEDTGCYRVLVGEDDFLTLYETFTRLLGYNNIEPVERGPLLEVWELMTEVIKEGLLRDVQMGYILRY